MTSHSGAMLPSMSSTRSPRRAPRSRSQLATWFERAAICAYVSRVSLSAVITRSASRSGCSAASTSNQSSAQLNSSSLGQANAALAAS